MKIKRHLVAAGLAVLAFGLLPQGLAQAVTMSPIRIELAADPGEQTNGIVKVYNDARQERTLYLSVAKFESKDENGNHRSIRS